MPPVFNIWSPKQGTFLLPPAAPPRRSPAAAPFRVCVRPIRSRRLLPWTEASGKLKLAPQFPCCWAGQALRAWWMNRQVEKFGNTGSEMRRGGGWIGRHMAKPRTSSPCHGQWTWDSGSPASAPGGSEQVLLPSGPFPEAPSRLHSCPLPTGRGALGAPRTSEAVATPICSGCFLLLGL